MSTTPEIKLNAATIEMADKLMQDMSIDAQGVITVAENAYEKLLPADIPAEIIKKLQAHNSVFFPAAWEATGNMARAAAVENTKITEVDARFPMIGKDRFDVSWTKSAERNAGIAEKGQVAEKKTVYGAMFGKITITGTDAGSGELKKVAQRQKAAAQEMFGTPVTAAA